VGVDCGTIEKQNDMLNSLRRRGNKLINLIAADTLWHTANL